MRKLFFMSVLLMAVCCSAQSVERFKLSEHYVTQKYELSEVGKLVSPSSIDVVYYQSPGKPYVEIYAPDNLLPHIALKELRGTLSVDYKGNLSFYGENRTEVRVYAPSITDFELLGSGDLTIPKGLDVDKAVRMVLKSSGDLECGDVRCDGLVADLGSSGDLKCGDLNCGKLVADLNGSGDMEVERVYGTSVQIRSNSSGDFTAKRVKCGEASLRVMSSGSCDVEWLDCSGTAAIESGSVGSVEVAGVCSRALLTANSVGSIKAGDMKADAVEAFSGSVGDIICCPQNSLKAKTCSTGSVVYLNRPKTLDLDGKNIRER